MDINLLSKYGVASTEQADKVGISFTGADGEIYTIWVPETPAFTPGDLENMFITAASLVRAHPRYKAATPTAETDESTQIQTAPIPVPHVAQDITNA